MKVICGADQKQKSAKNGKLSVHKMVLISWKKVGYLLVMYNANLAVD